MKKLLTVLFVLISLIAKAQPSPTSSQVRFPAVWVQFRDTATARPSDTACIFYFNNNFWVRRNSSSFFQNLLDGSGTVTSIAQGFGIVSTPNPITTTGTVTTDTTVIVSKSYFNNFNALNVKYADTSAMLTPYLRKSDTASMLSNYYNKTAADGRFVPLTRSVNTNAPLSGGGSLTSNLTIVADTGRAVGQLSTGGSLNKVKDSLVGNIALKLNISDTAAMLANRLKISDTLTMLVPYLRKSDTATMLSPYALKSSGNDFIRNQTSSNLSAQTAKFWVSDTIKTDGLVQALRVSANNTGITPAINGQNTSTGRAGSFTAATGVGAYITNRSATNPALYVLQDSTSSIARFVNNFDLGVTIDTSGDVTISNRKSTFTGKIQLPTIAANRIYTLPDNSGVLALTSNVTDSSAALRASINTKLNIADTAAMLTNYPRKDGTRATGTWNISTTGSSGSVANALTIGTGLSGTSYNGSAAVTIANTGVLSNVAGTGITVSGATGNVTITNAGVTSIAGTANQITASASTGGVTLSIPTAFIAPGYIQATSNLIAKQNTNSATGVALYLKRDTDTGPLGYIIQSQNAAATANLFTVDVNGAVIGSSYTGNLVNALTFGAGLNAGTFNNSAASTVSIATGGVTNAMLANSTISGTALGGTLPSLTFGTYLTGGSYNGTGAVTLATNATALNTASTLVARDASGNFAAGTITAALSGNATTSTTLQTARLINGVSFNGSADITVTASTTAALTMNNSGAGAVSGATFNGGTAQTISYNTIGAPSTTGTNASGTWGINITGTAAGETLATVTGRGSSTTTAVTFNGGHTSISAALSGVQPASVATNGTAATSILNATGGKGGNTTGTTGQIAGAGSLVSLIAGAGGDAPAGSTNGNGGNVVIQSGVAGSGLGTAGSAGTISLNIGGTTALGIAANQAVTLSSSVTASRGIFSSLITLGNDGTYGTTYKTLGLTGDVNGAHRIFAGTADDIYIAAATGRGIRFWTDGGSADRLIISSTGAATFSSSVTANSLIKSGGSSSQFLMADGSVTTLAGGVASGTYTPTLTNGSTVTSSTANISQYNRVGNIVTVAGQMSITVGSTGANNMGISLPIASNLLASADLSGTANSSSGNLLSNQVEGSATNDRAVFYFTASVTGTYLITYVFSYEVK